MDWGTPRLIETFWWDNRVKNRAKINKKDPSVSIWAVEMFKNVKQSYSPVHYVTNNRFVQIFGRFSQLYIFGKVRSYWTCKVMFTFFLNTLWRPSWNFKMRTIFCNHFAIFRLLSILGFWFWCLNIHFRDKEPNRTTYDELYIMHDTILEIVVKQYINSK